MRHCKTCGIDAVGVEYTWIIANGRCCVCEYRAERLRHLAHSLRTLVVVGP